MQSCNIVESSQDSHSDDSSEHFFVPLSGAGFSRLGPENNKSVSTRSKRLFVSQADTSLLEDHVGSKYNGLPDLLLNDLESLDDYDPVNGFLSAAGSNAISDAANNRSSFYDMEESQDQVFSPPLLMDTSLLEDSYEDLLGMLVLLHSFTNLYCINILTNVCYYVVFPPRNLCHSYVQCLDPFILHLLPFLVYVCARALNFLKPKPVLVPFL